MFILELPNFVLINLVISVISILQQLYWNIENHWNTSMKWINPFLVSVPILYPPVNSRKPKVFWCFQEVENENIGQKRVKKALVSSEITLLGRLFLLYKLRESWKMSQWDFSNSKRLHRLVKIKDQKNSLKNRVWEIEYDFRPLCGNNKSYFSGILRTLSNF